MARKTLTACACAFALVLLAGSLADVSAGKLKMCAFRDGPRGPCTCKSATNVPGQWTVTAKSRCRRAAAAPEAKAPAAEAQTGSDIVTGANPDPAPALDTAQAPDLPVEPSPAQADPLVEATPAKSEPDSAPARAQAGSNLVPVPGTGSMDVGAINPSALTGGPHTKLDDVRARGKLLCGVSTGLLGFSAQTQSGEWHGLDADFCRAVSAAVFGDPTRVEFIPLETDERFSALNSGKIDLLSRNTTWTMDRDVDHGIEFVGVLYFDGQSFLTREQGGLVSAQQLGGQKICVETPTTSERNLAYYLKSQNITAEVVTFTKRKELMKAYVDGTCDTITGDRSALYSERAKLAEPLNHVVLPEIISKDPLGPAVVHDDLNWEEVVRWTLAGLVNAEEVGLDKASALATQPLPADAQRLVDGAGATGTKMHLNKSWLRDVVAAVGNYGEMFELNVGKGSPLGMNRGLNALWKKGGILYSPPMW